MSVLRRLDDFRGASRFTTWVYKFALLEAAVKLRKRAWQGREIPLEPEGWELFSSAALEPDAEAEQSELLATLQNAIAEVLLRTSEASSSRSRVNGVPIDVLAERLNTNRGALYKTLHDARRKLRKHLDERGLALDDWLEDMTMERARSEADAGTAPRAGGAGSRLRRLLPGARSLRRARARRRRRRRGGARPARPSRRLPRLPRGARQPARPRRRRAGR